MGILQHALGVVGHVHAQILLVEPVPGLGQVLDLQGAGDQLLLQLVPDHDVEGVGELVRLRADEAGLALVDGQVEVVGGDVLERLGPQLLDVGQDVGEEGFAAADDVLIEPALGLVDAHAGAAAQGGVLDVVADVQLVEGVAPLVDDGVHAGGESLLVIVGGDAHVVLGEVGGEGVLHLADVAVVPVDGHDLHEPVGELALLGEGEPGAEEAVVHHGSLLHHGLHHGQQLLSEEREELIQGGHGEPLLVHVEEHIVGGLGAVPVPGELAGIVHQRLEMGREEGEIVGHLGGVPGVGGGVLGHLIGHVLLHGDLLGPLHVLVELLGLPAGDVVHLLLVLQDLLHPGLQVRAGGELVHLLGKDRVGHPQVLRPALGHGGLGIVVEDAESVAVGVHFAQMLLEFADGLFHMSPHAYIFVQYTKAPGPWQFAARDFNQNNTKAGSLGLLLLFRILLLFRSVDANGLLPQMTGLELDHAVDLGKQGIVLADPNVDAGMEVGAPLAHEDVPRQHGLAVCLLGSKTLAFAVSAVTGRAHALLMREQLQIHRKHSSYLPV